MTLVIAEAPHARGAKPNGASAAGDRLGSIALADLGPLRLDQPYLGKRLIVPGDLALLVGPPASGKTTCAPDLAWRIAAGLPFLGRRTCAAGVLYTPLEDHEGLRRRFAALEAELGPPPPIRIAQTPVDLLECGVGAIAEVADAHAIGLVIVDTLNSACPGLDENSPQEMGRAVAALRAIATPSRAVLAVHHTPRGGQHPRGHSALEAAADTILSVIPPEAEGGSRALRITKCRHGPAGESWPFTIRPVTLGVDADGDEVAGLIPEWGEPERPDKATRRPLTGKAKLALRMLHDVLAAQGKPLPAEWNIPGDLPAVPLETWRTECASAPSRTRPARRRRPSAAPSTNSGCGAASPHESTRARPWSGRCGRGSDHVPRPRRSDNFGHVRTWPALSVWCAPGRSGQGTHTFRCVPCPSVAQPQRINRLCPWCG